MSCMEVRRVELYGQVVRRVALPHFLITETYYQPGMNLPSHGHNFSYLSFVLQGAYQEMCQQRREDCSAGSLIFHPGDEVHSNNFQSIESRCLNLHLTFDQNLVDVDFSKRKHSKNRITAVLTTKIYREI